MGRGAMSEVPACVRVLLPPGSILLGPTDRPQVTDLLRLGKEARVALAANGVGSRGRLQRRAARLGLSVQAEYVVLPTWQQPTFVVEDDRDLLGWLLASLATVPPNLTRGTWLVDVVARAIRTPWGRAAVARLAPARLLVGAPR